MILAMHFFVVDMEEFWFCHGIDWDVYFAGVITEYKGGGKYVFGEVA